MQERGQGGGLATGMSVGYKLAARLVNSLSNKVFFPPLSQLSTHSCQLWKPPLVVILVFRHRLLSTLVPADHNVEDGAVPARNAHWRVYLTASKMCGLVEGVKKNKKNRRFLVGHPRTCPASGFVENLRLLYSSKD